MFLTILNFAIERLKNGIDLVTPIACDVRHLYPKEAELGTHALKILEHHADVILPDNEAVSVALHFINAEAESGAKFKLLSAQMLQAHTMQSASEIIFPVLPQKVYVVKGKVITLPNTT